MISLGEFSQIVADQAVWCADCCVQGTMGLGQVEDVIKSTISTLGAKYGPQIAQELQALAEPAAKKALEVIKPAVEQALREQVPVFSGIVGTLLGAAVLAGVWISRKTYQRTVRARRNWGWGGGWRF